MTVIITMRNQFEPVHVQGDFKDLAHNINLQMAQGKQLIVVQATDDSALGLNINNINTIKEESAEDAFSLNA